MTDCTNLFCAKSSGPSCIWSPVNYILQDLKPQCNEIRETEKKIQRKQHNVKSLEPLKQQSEECDTELKILKPMLVM